MAERVYVGGSGNSRLLEDYGPGNVVEQATLVGDVPMLLLQILTELRRQSQLLRALVDDDFEDDEDTTEE